MNVNKIDSSSPPKTGNFGMIILTLAMVFASVFVLQCGSSYIRQFNDPAQAEIAKQKELKALARGRDIWMDPNTGTNGRSCESCHENGRMTNAEAYPRYKHILRTMATLSITHNFAVVNESKGKPWELGSADANALVLYVKSLANRKTINMAWPKTLKKEWVKRGKIAFHDPNLGRNDRTCSSCHDKRKKNENTGIANPVQELTGVAATFPRYSFELKKVITLEQQVNYCIKNKLAAAPLPLDDETIVALCCYVTSLSEGKRVAVATF